MAVLLNESSSLLFLLVVSFVLCTVVTDARGEGRDPLMKEMILIPAGEFVFGEKEREPENLCKRDFFVLERKERVDSFYIDRFEVTNGEYAEFVKATKHPPPPHWEGEEPNIEIRDLPVTFVNYEDAVAYANWADKRLPTEKEWEKAARGTDGRKYPWGNDEPTSERAVFFRTRGNGPRPVGSCPAGASPHGCRDMAGNVLEWTSTQVEGTDERIVRGGDWANVPENLRCSRRTPALFDIRSGDLGFRCVADELPQGASLWKKRDRVPASPVTASSGEPEPDPHSRLKRPSHGAHPRIFFSAQDLPKIRTHMAKSTFVARSWGYLEKELKKAWADDGPEKSYCEEILDKGNLQTKPPGNQDAFSFTVFHALVTEKKEELPRARRAILSLAAHAGAAKEANYNLLAQLALVYDLGFGFLSEDQRKVARAGLINQGALMARSSKVSFFGLGRPSFYRAFDWCPLFNAPLGMAALALEGEMDEHTRMEWEKIAAGAMQDYFQVGIGRDGSCLDGMAYFGFGNWYTNYLLDGLKMRGMDLYEHPHLRKVPDWLAMEVLPWGNEFNSFGKTHLRPPVGLIFAGMHHAWPEKKAMQWAWNNHTGYRTYTCIPIIVYGDPMPDSEPKGLPLVKHFRGRDMVIARTDWTKNAVMFVTRYGREVHAQADTGSFTLYGYGSFFAIDPGMETRLSEGHSIARIDGKSMGSDLSSTEGKIRRFEHSPLATMVHGDAAQAYSHYYPWRPQHGKKVAAIPMKEASRYFAFVTGEGAPPYLMIRERLKQDDQHHAYEWLLQLSPGATCELSENTANVFSPLHSERHEPTEDSVRNLMTVRFLSPEKVDLSTDTFGKKSLDFGVHPRLKAEVGGTEADFAILLYPHTKEMPAATVESKHVPGGLYVQLKWPGTTDHWLFAQPEKNVAADLISSDAVMAMVRERDGKVSDFLCFEGKSLSWNGKTIHQSDAD